MKEKINEYFQNYWTKKQIIYKGITLVVCFLIVFIPSFSMHEFAVHSTKQYYGALDSFLHINITLNSGAAYGMLSDKPEVATAIQGIFSFLVFFVTLIALNKLPYLAVGFFISFGGMFNFFDHLVPLTMAIDVFDYGPAGTMIEGVVVDYFQFWKTSGIFNFPDMFVTVSCVCLLLFIICQWTFYLVKKVDPTKPFYLFIDSSSTNLNIAVFQQKVIVKKSIPTKNNLTDISVKHIDRLMKLCGVDKKNIGRIYVTKGPGGFTGVKIAILIAKAWAVYNPKIEIYDISSLQLQIISSGISIQDAKGKKFYTAIYKDNQIQDEIKVLPYEEIEQKSKELNLPIYQSNTLPKNFIFSALLIHLNDFKLTAPELLEPLYVKEAVNN